MSNVNRFKGKPDEIVLEAYAEVDLFPDDEMSEFISRLPETAIISGGAGFGSKMTEPLRTQRRVIDA